MTTRTDRSQTALLVIDMQRDVVAEAHDVDRVASNFATLVAAARSANVPVVWVQRADDATPTGSDGWCIVDEFQRTDDEPVAAKRFGDAHTTEDMRERGSPLSPEQARVHDRVPGRLRCTGTDLFDGHHRPGRLRNR